MSHEKKLQIRNHLNPFLLNDVTSIVLQYLLPTFTRWNEECKKYVKFEPKFAKDQWCIYLIAKANEPVSSKSCYIGSTNNLYRRMRQHQGEIKGGAKKTRYYRGQVQIIAIITGCFLHTQTQHKDVLRAEWALQHATKRKSLKQKMEILNTSFFKREKWTKASEPIRSEKRTGNPFFTITWFHETKRPTTPLLDIPGVVRSF
jgi:predicted GIY-YIG superfamily endonuclease